MAGIFHAFVSPELRRRAADDLEPRSDHDLLIRIATDLSVLVDGWNQTKRDLETLRRRFDEHLVWASSEAQKLSALADGDINDGQAIQALTSWRAEMLGAWKVIRIVLGLVGAGTIANLAIALATAFGAAR